MGKVSEKNTKKEILQYCKLNEELLLKAQNQLDEEREKFGSEPLDPVKREQQVAIGMLSKIDPEVIRTQRNNINVYYGSIETEAFKIQEEIDVLRLAKSGLQEEIKTLHKINASVEALQVLTRAHEIEKDQFEKEKKIEIDEHLERSRVFCEEQKERSNKSKYDFEKMVSNWEYDFEVKKKKDIDIWERSKETRDYEFKRERNEDLEKVRKAQEDLELKQNEFTSLKTEVGLFPARLEKEIELAKDKLKKQIEQSTNFKVSAITKQHEVTTKVMEEKILNLSERVKELTTFNTQLNVRLECANDKVENIAKEAISNASKQKFVVNTGSDKDGKQN